MMTMLLVLFSIDVVLQFTYLLSFVFRHGLRRSANWNISGTITGNGSNGVMSSMLLRDERLAFDIDTKY